MHGRKRSKRAAVSAEELRAQRAKLGKLRALGDIALQSYRAKDYSDNSLQLTTKLLSVNPDFGTLWNFRRTILLSRWNGLTHAQRAEVAQEELRLTAEAISQRNPKSYGAWFHRKWVVLHCGKEEEGEALVDLEAEIGLCKKLLEADERNFHCWSYRAFVLHQMGPVDSAKEMEFAATLIERNFSNYAAWNLRSLHIDIADPQALKAEFELLQDAIFTEPADQSCWIYQRWLIQQVMKQSTGIEAALKEEILKQQIDMCRELLTVEEGCKWGMLTLMRLLQLQRHVPVHGATDAGIDTDMHKEEIQSLCSQLTQVDPIHKEYYSHLLHS